MKNRIAAPLAAIMLLLAVFGSGISPRLVQPAAAAVASQKQTASGQDTKKVAEKATKKAVKQTNKKTNKKTTKKTANKTTKKAIKKTTKKTAKKTSQKAAKKTVSGKKVEDKKQDSATTENSTERKQPTDRGAVTKISSILRTAYTLQGVPYRHGGQSKKGFDCSGFTSYVFKLEAGISLPRTSSGQAKVGTAVKKMDLKPGDLVYFNTNGRSISHVGIYIGDNNFIHASRTKGITITSLSDSYYLPKYLGARRVI